MTDIICSGCLEMLSGEELKEERTPCCDEIFLVGVDYTQYDSDVDQYLLLDFANSKAEKKEMLEKIRALPSNSKKRRMGYPPVEDNWPGRKFKGTRKERGKRPPTSKKPSNKSYVNLSTEDRTGGYEVEIKGKFAGVFYDEDRASARKKARTYLRSIGQSITTADAIYEEEGKTVIIYGDD